MTMRKFKIHKEGYRIIIGVFVLLVAMNVSGWLIWQGPGVLHIAGLVASLLLFAFIVMFFRTPARVVEPDPLPIYAPADGKIVVIGTPSDLKDSLGGDIITLAIQKDQDISGLIKEVEYVKEVSDGKIAVFFICPEESKEKFTKMKL